MEGTCAVLSRMALALKGAVFYGDVVVSDIKPFPIS